MWRSPRRSPAGGRPRGSSSPATDGLQAIALAGDDAPGVPAGVLVGFDAPALNDNDELAFVATVRRGRDTLDVLYFWNGRRLQRLVAEGDRLLRIGGTMDKIGEPALNNGGVIAFPAAILKGPALGGIFVAGARDLRLLVGAGDRTPSGAMILRFSERVAIDDEDGIAFGAYLGEDGGTREAVLRTGPEGLAEIAVEGAPAPGGGRYAGFGPWPTVGPGGVTAFIAALDGGPGPLAAFAGTAGDIRRVATMGETLPQGGSDRSLRTQCGRRGGTGRRADFRDDGAGGRGAQRDLLPLSGGGAVRDFGSGVPRRDARSMPLAEVAGSGIREHCHCLNVYQGWSPSGSVRSLGSSTGSTADIRWADAEHDRRPALAASVRRDQPWAGAARYASMVRDTGSGRAGAAGKRGGGRADQRQAGRRQDVPAGGGEIAAVADDGRGNNSRERVASGTIPRSRSIGENRAGRATAHFSAAMSPVWGRRRRASTRTGAAVRGLGGARLARGWAAWVAGSRTGRLISLASSAAARSRPRVMRARISPTSTTSRSAPATSPEAVAEVRCCSAAARCRP